MSWFDKGSAKTPKPPALDAKDQKIYELEIRLADLEQAIIELCRGMSAQFDRIDQNTAMLDKNMHRLATLTIRPPKDLLGGNQETN